MTASRTRPVPIRTPPWRTSLAVALLLLLWACGRDEHDPPPAREAGSAGLGLQRVWEVVLEESDSLYLSSPGDFAIDPDDGSFYVADAFAGHVLQVDRRGRPVRVFGKKGRGPGEFSQVALMFAHGPHLVVEDVGLQRFSRFGRQSGVFERSLRHGGILGDAVVTGDTAWLGLQNMDRGTGVARWDLRSDSLEYLVPVPAEYRASPPLAGIFNGVSLAAWADTLLVGFQGSDELYLYSTRGEPLDTVAVPVRRRKGVPDDVAARLQKLDYPGMFGALSALFDLARLPDGRVALVHFDQQLAGPRIIADVYVTLLSADRRSACVDEKLPLSRDTQPRTAFRGDTLFVLEQTLTAAGQPRTAIAAYRVSAGACRWTPVG